MIKTLTFELLGSIIRKVTPGITTPTQPNRRYFHVLVDIVITGDVSVNPYPSTTGTPISS